jgi:hypothetical protein
MFCCTATQHKLKRRFWLDWDKNFELILEYAAILLEKWHSKAQCYDFRDRSRSRLAFSKGIRRAFPKKWQISLCTYTYQSSKRKNISIQLWECLIWRTSGKTSYNSSGWFIQNRIRNKAISRSWLSKRRLQTSNIRRGTHVSKPKERVDWDIAECRLSSAFTAAKCN